VIASSSVPSLGRTLATCGGETGAQVIRDEPLDGEIFYSLREAQIVIESWRRHDNSVRLHASLRYRPSAPEMFVSAFAA
jgi:hypothetical protein